MAKGANQSEALLNQFAQVYGHMDTYLEQYEETAMRILNSGPQRLSLVVQHAAITHRIQRIDQILDKLRRLQRDRIELSLHKQKVEADGGNWESFCGHWHMRDKINETEPFTSVEGMFAALHDLVDFRISLRFPNDIDKVVKYFSMHREFEVVVPPRLEGGLSRDFEKIRKLVGKGHHAYDQMSPPPFAHGKSTRLVVRLKEDNFKARKLPRGTVINVQIGTTIMHSWSDIYDTIYTQIGNRIPSEEDTRMLELINGMAGTGEVALEQLEFMATKTDLMTSLDSANNKKSSDPKTIKAERQKQATTSALPTKEKIRNMTVRV